MNSVRSSSSSKLMIELLSSSDSFKPVRNKRYFHIIKDFFVFSDFKDSLVNSNVSSLPSRTNTQIFCITLESSYYSYSDKRWDKQLKNKNVWRWLFKLCKITRFCEFTFFLQLQVKRFFFGFVFVRSREYYPTFWIADWIDQTWN